MFDQSGLGDWADLPFFQDDLPAIALAVVLLALLTYVNVRRVTSTCDPIERTPGARYDGPTGVWQLPEGDVVALRGCLQALIDDPVLWADLARRGRERALARFTQAQIAAQTLEVYRAALA